MKNILIATILPNGINPQNKNYQFSVCFDLNKNIDPTTYKADQLLATIKGLFASIKGFANKGFALQINGQVVPVPANQMLPITSTKNLDALRDQMWNLLFQFKPSSEPIADIGMFKDFPTAINLLGANLINGDLRALSQARVLAHATVAGAAVRSADQADAGILDAAQKMLTDYGAEFESLWDKMDGIRNFSEELSRQQKDEFYQRELNRSLAAVTSNPAAPDAGQPDNSISIEKLFDTISLLQENTIIQRIAGLTCDFELTAAQLGGATQLQMAFTAIKENELDDAWLLPLSSVRIYSRTTGTVTKSLVLLEGLTNDCAGIYQSTELQLFNHDKLTRAEAMKQVFEKLKIAGNPAALPASQRHELVKAIKSVDTSTTLQLRFPRE